MSFGKKIIELRTEKDLSRSEFAEKIQISYSALSKYETDERFPDKETLQKIADFLDVSIDYMLGRTTKRKYDIETTAFHVTGDGLSDEDVKLVENLIESLKEKHKK